MNVRKNFLLVNCLALACALIEGALYGTAPVQELECKASDVWFEARGPVTPPQDIAIVGMDNESYSQLSLSPLKPWPRAIHARLLERAHDLGARAVVFDLLFQGKADSEQGDEALANGLSLLPSVIAGEPKMRVHTEKQITSRFMPDERFAKSASAVGSFIASPDNGVLRAFWNIAGEERKVTPLSMAALAVAGQTLDNLPQEQDLINFYGPSGTIPVVSYYSVLNSNDSLGTLLAGKILFVGQYRRLEAYGTVHEDSLFTPYRRAKTFGVEVHATIAGNLLRGDWIRRFPMTYEAGALTMAAYFLCLLMLSVRPNYGAALLVAAGFSWAGLSYISFLNGLFIPGVSLVTFILPPLFLANTLYYYVTVHRAQKHIREAFSLYLSPAMVENIASSVEKPKLGGERAEVTILFTDIQGFTTWSEQNDPEDVCATVNRYFSKVADSVLDSGATLIKFLGDGMFVMWGAPVHLDDPSDRALASAIGIQRTVLELAARNGFPHFITRVGIHRGRVVVGNLGSERRFDYTAIGDAVNVASRLEGLNKFFGTSIIISETVLLDLKNPCCAALPLGKACVAGKDSLLDLFAVPQSPVNEAGFTAWAVALKRFQDGEWDAAKKAFETLDNTLLERVSVPYVSFMNQHGQTPPRDWNGAITFEAK